MYTRSELGDSLGEVPCGNLGETLTEPSALLSPSSGGLTLGTQLLEVPGAQVRALATCRACMP